MTTIAVIATLLASQLPVARVDSLVEAEMKSRKIPGVAIAVVDHGKVVLRKAYGLANLETETPLRPDAVFELASITKQFTAAGIMLLVRDGKVRLDEPIASYIANTPAAWSGITVRHLLTHTGGLQISALPRPATMNITTEQAFDFVTKQPAQFPVGSNGWYSDAGYFLLGMIIEKTSGQSYRDFMQQRVFDPLGLTNTSITDRFRVIKGRVATYSISPRTGQLVNWRRDWDYELPSFFGIWSTLDDMVKWDVALRNKTLLDDAALQQMWTPAKVNSGAYASVLDNYYGFGFTLADLRGRRLVEHGGASGTHILRLLDQPLTIIVLTNLDNPSGRRHPVYLTRAIAGMLRPELQPAETLTPRPDPSPDLTQRVRTLLEELAADREPSGATDAFKRATASSPGRRAITRSQLQGLSTITYLGSDDVSQLAQWGPEQNARLVYYRVIAGSQTHTITVGVTPDGKVARLDIPFQPQ